MGLAKKSRAAMIVAARIQPSIPATELELFTGSEYPKTRWRVRLRDSEWFCFAGVWRQAEGNWPESFAAVTIPAAPDIAQLTDLQMAVIPPDRAKAWLTLSCPQAELLKSLPEVESEPKPLISGMDGKRTSNHATKTASRSSQPPRFCSALVYLAIAAALDRIIFARCPPVI
jgi:putative SOS response-associated peptidase YedK